jgi:adenosine deaminase CECR1
MLRMKTISVAVTIFLIPTAIRAQESAAGRPKIQFIDVMRELIGEANRARQPGFRLTADEKKAAEYLRKLQREDLDQYKRTKLFPGAKAFYSGKDAIELSRTFTILRKMPKGGALHIHSIAAGRARWIVYHASQRPNCYVYWPSGPVFPPSRHIKGELGFFSPGREPLGFQPIADVRGSVKDFDQQLLALLTLGPEDESIPDVWIEFSNCMQRVGNVLAYQPVFIDYFVDAFETLIADGVDYVELRTGLGRLFDLEGNTWSGERFIEQYLKVRERVQKKHPGFDFKLIVSSSRFSHFNDVWKDLVALLPLRLRYPSFVVGYDLVGEEDSGNKTLYYFKVLLAAVYLYLQSHVTIPFYLHDGESNWRDSSNVRYAFLLHTRRIGHGLNLYLFPRLEQYYIKRRIPLEVCPISNQVLRYVSDLRLHPANVYLRKGVTCVISSDDPGVFGYEGLSYDFWEAFMAWELELIDLKQLAINSIEFSAMSRPEKRIARQRWENEWKNFIQDLNRQRAAGNP